MKLAETKRVYTYNIQMNTPTPVAAGNTLTESFIYNPLAVLGNDSLPVTTEGTEFLDPMLVGRFSVQLDWVRFASSFNSLPTVLVNIYLIASNVEYTASGATGRVMTTLEEAEFWLRRPSANLSPVMNTDNVTVISRRKLRFAPKAIVSGFGGTGLVSRETKTVKISRRLRGTKQQNFEISAGGTGQTKSGYLKGYNFYWVVTTMSNGQANTAGTAFSPLSVQMDSYVYFKDL